MNDEQFTSCTSIPQPIRPLVMGTSSSVLQEHGTQGSAMAEVEKEDWSRLSKAEFCKKMKEYIQGAFAEKLADPEERDKILRRCGYSLDKNGNPQVVPI